MFRKLRNRLLILNMAITSLVMLTAFLIIFLATQQNVSSEDQMRQDSLWELSEMTPDIISFGDGRWEYIRKDADISTDGDLSQINFLDIIDSTNTLNDLSRTLFLVAILVLVAVFFISLFFANRAIKPISFAWEKQKQFVADASHELKTPLAIISANCDALEAHKEETIESQMKWLNYIRAGAQRMTKMSGELLALATLENSSSLSERFTFDLRDLIQEILSSMEGMITEKEIDFQTQMEDNLTIKSDIEKLQQVIVILLDNALKYTDPKGYIRLSCTKSKHRVIFRISNSGKGIHKEDLPKVFDRFYRGDPSRAHGSGGQGLGLSIAKTAIESLGGEIWVESVMGQWTTFSFSITY